MSDDELHDDEAGPLEPMCSECRVRGPVALVVIADNYRMAKFYALEHNFGREGRDWRYVSEPRQLRGYSGGRYVSFSADGGRNLHGAALARRVELNAALDHGGWEPLW